MDPLAGKIETLQDSSPFNDYYGFTKKDEQVRMFPQQG